MSTEWLKSLVEVIRLFLDKPPLSFVLTVAVTAWILVFPFGFFRSLWADLGPLYKAYIAVVALTFTIWAMFVFCERIYDVMFALWRNYAERKQKRRRLSDLEDDEKLLLATFLKVKRHTLNQSVIPRELWDAALRLYEDGILRLRGVSSEFELDSWTWRYIEEHKKFLHR